MLFSEDKNIKAEEIKQYLSIDVGLSFDTIKPYIASCEAEYIKPLLGTLQYNELLAYYNWKNTHSGSGSYNNTGSSSADAPALELLLQACQKALINLAFFRGFAIVIVSGFANNGPYRLENENQKTLYKYQEDNLRDLFKTEGFNGLDEILRHLEENINLYPLFEASAQYQSIKTSFIKSAVDFSNCHFINDNRLIFVRLQPNISAVEQKIIKPQLGLPLYNKIKNDQAFDNELTTLIKYAIAKLSIADAITHFNLNITEQGLMLTELSLINSYQKNKPADVSLNVSVRTEAEKEAQSYLDMITEYLAINTEKFKDYYDPQTKASIIEINNTNKKIITIF